MGDFQQNGVIATLHNIGNHPTEQLERELVEFNKARPMVLVLPSLFSELEGPALEHIVDTLSSVNYLSHIVIGLDRADKDQFLYAKDYFAKLNQPHSILWNDGPRLKALDAQLQDMGLAPPEPGKGRNVWYCFGYTLAMQMAEVIGLHDCDIVTYDRSLLARLMYPVANPEFSYVFSKGYYSRVADGKLNGRVTRLLMTPLIHALKKVIGANDYLDYLDAFRYPLAGEFAMRAGVVADIRIPSDWGLEVGVLSEVRRNYANRVICQVDIADAYDHKHQKLGEDDPNTGLSRMSTDISKSIFRKLATDGTVLSPEVFRTLKATYLRTALDMVEAYYTDARMNGLMLDRHKEEQTVELFASNIMRAGEVFLETPHEKPFIPSWSRIQSAVPDFMRQLKEAVKADSEDV